MKLLRLSAHSALKVPQPRAVAIGNFDGVHLGHQKVITTMLQAAKTMGLRATVLTFYPHPKQFFAGPNTMPFLLQTHADKWRRMQQLGVEELAVMRFNATTAALSPEQFMQQLLRDVLQARFIVTGENFAFGKNRAGNVEQLKAWARSDCEVVAAKPVMAGETLCASSTLRTCLVTGDMLGVAVMMGGPYSTRARVIEGQKLGRKLGFPTANMRLPASLLSPAYGIYAVWAYVHGVRHAAVASYGVRPSIGTGLQPLLEVHILEGDHALYGETLRVEWIQKLRDEETFDSLEMLQARMHDDCQRARDVLTREV